MYADTLDLSVPTHSFPTRRSSDLVAYRSEHPGDDVTSTLITTRDEDDSQLSEKELVDTLMLVINAGHETTVNLLDQAIVALLTHPEQRAAVVAGLVS